MRLEGILSALDCTRRAGHTRSLAEAVTSETVVVVGSSGHVRHMSDELHRLGKKPRRVICAADLDAFIGCYGPILFDTSAVYEICRISLTAVHDRDRAFQEASHELAICRRTLARYHEHFGDISQ